MATIMITHSLADLDALPTAQDRANARFRRQIADRLLKGQSTVWVWDLAS